MRRALALAGILSCATAAVAAAPFERTETRTPCAVSDPLRRPFFGDLHVHTALSLDASTQDTRNRPRDAYRFARGEPLGIQPYDDAGHAGRTVRLTRPLDFVAVTDHAEAFGEVRICQTDGLPGHDSAVCRLYRWLPRFAFMLMNGDMIGTEQPTRYAFCGDEARHCAEAARGPWQEIQDAADAAYDRSPACGFTTFVAYEWSRTPNTVNLHRNVIFRNAVVPTVPISAVDALTPDALWRRLDAECLDAGRGCDVLAIPHNSNLSAGQMFQVEPGTEALRAELEPLVEVMQHKGDSECFTGLGTTDELCGFEKLAVDRFGGKFREEMRFPPKAGSFVRDALFAGLSIEHRTGVNPFRVGLIGSTDTHIATPGLVDEDGHPGHGGASVAQQQDAASFADEIDYNPGGLAVIWAEENSRDALFAAMRRRETYATSGPRIVVRSFGGWGYAGDLCDDPRLAATGYAGGVPMGGVLPPAPSTDARPRIVVAAERDPMHGRLQRVQIVKGTRVGDRIQETIYDVAGTTTVGTVDAATCRADGAGADRLCTVWHDPDFDPHAPAVYYARVLEEPSCRWSTYVCNRAQVDCARPESVPSALTACCDPNVPRLIQERAWTSPIWYTPPR